MNENKVYWQLWYDWEFRQGKLFNEMLNTVEDSPYHREANTGEHTNMVLSAYDKLSPEIWSRETMLGAIACAYHDVGKPVAEEIITDGELTKKRYFGHELTSARLFIDDALSTDSLSGFELSNGELYVIALMIEYHVPWKLGDDKLKTLFSTIKKFDMVEVFIRVLLADQTGRDSDPEIRDLRDPSKWIEKFKTMNEVSLIPDITHKSLVMMIGPSGSGKSTATVESELNVFSMDKMRLDLCDSTDYSKSYLMSCDDKEFNGKCNSKFMTMLKTAEKDNTSLIVDNINISKKSRRFYLLEAKKKGFRTVGILFLVDLKTCQERAVRSDKSVSPEVVKRQFMNLQLPLFGEFDDIIVI